MAGLLGEHRENEQAKLAIVEHPAAVPPPASPAFMFMSMFVVVMVAPTVLAPIAEGVGMTVVTVSVCVLHAHANYIAIYLKSRYIEITLW
ncbi:hypothetical protein [Bosea sp. RAF48]|uniref:hypothetical protein n=1 Tax=Bosea sp. RAF48 TaxID=3237480 RepID=UPI003F934129